MLTECANHLLQKHVQQIVDSGACGLDSAQQAMLGDAAHQSLAELLGSKAQPSRRHLHASVCIGDMFTKLQALTV